MNSNLTRQPKEIWNPFIIKKENNEIIILSDDENYVSVKQYKKTEERELFYKNHKAEISRLEGSYEKAVFMNFVKRGDKRGMRYYYSFMSSIKKKEEEEEKRLELETCLFCLSSLLECKAKDGSLIITGCCGKSYGTGCMAMHARLLPEVNKIFFSSFFNFSKIL
jgi:hypothetical protein